MAEYSLLNKTEITIKNIRLKNANLSDIAACVADVLGFEPDEILVVDYRDEALTLDILKPFVDAHKIVGRKDQVLDRLKIVPGVEITPDTSFQSDGMLGWISMDEEAAKEALVKAEQMAAEIMANIAKRIIVFSSGLEVAERQIEDTNTPLIMKRLQSEGYKVYQGETLKDDREFIAGRLGEAAKNGGYRAIITTGGVGAEDKDHTVEAITILDPEAATPYICHFKIGTGRHVKDGIRIAVGEYSGTLIIALPGPNDEVKASLDVIVEGLKMNQDKQTLAENISAHLRNILREKTVVHRHTI